MLSDRLDAVFFTPHLGPSLAVGTGILPGGAELQVLLIARGLAARGWRTGLVVYDDPPGSLPERVDGVRLIGLRRKDPGAGLCRAALSHATAFARVLPRLRARVVVQRAAGAETGLAGVAGRAVGGRFVYSSAHNYDFDFKRLGSHPILVWAFHLGIALADRIVVQTHEQEELCTARFGRRPELIRNIAEPALARSGPGSAFLWVGRLIAYKCPQAFLALARRLPEARFRLVAPPAPRGEESLQLQIEQECAELENVELFGPLPRHELGRLLDDAVAIVNTSEAEGMSNVILEAWSRGVPALALNHDPDQLISTERLGGFADGSIDRLVELAHVLWRERYENEGLAHRCRDYVVLQHGAETVLDRWEHVLGLTDGQTGRACVRASFDRLRERLLSVNGHRALD